MNLELRGGIMDGAIITGYGETPPGKVIRIAQLPQLKLTPQDIHKLAPPEVLYVITHEVNKNGDVVADVKNNP